MNDSANSSNYKSAGSLVAMILGMLAAVIVTWMGITPWYWVYHQRMEGEAELAKAEYSKRVAVQEANAKKDAASLLADADVERAKGVAKANQIIGQSLENNPEYLTWLWLEGLREGPNEVIYIATEAGIPIFEAGGRFHQRRQTNSMAKPTEKK